MKTTQNIFERKEKKYLLTREQYEAFLTAAAARIEPDEFFHSDITSTYFDTPGYDVIIRSLEKPVYKEKLRVRDYAGGPMFVELKKKADGIVYKRRIAVPEPLVEKWTDGERPLADVLSEDSSYAMGFKERQISGEIDSFCRRFGGELSPAMNIIADRYSYRERGSEEGARLTFDTGIWFEELRGAGNCAPGMHKLTDFVVMETKIKDAYPIWLSKMLSSLHILPSSFSKYGTAYKQVFGNRDREGKLLEYSSSRAQGGTENA